MGEPLGSPLAHLGGVGEDGKTRNPRLRSGRKEVDSDVVGACPVSTLKNPNLLEWSFVPLDHDRW